MPLISSNSSNPCANGFIISLFIHVTLFYAFTFSFSTKPVVQKPKLIFLGSILKDQDLTMQYSQRVATLVPYSPLAGKKSTLYNNSVEKPHEAPNKKPASKVTLKGLFPLEPMSTEAKDDAILDELDIQLKLEPYRPLKINP